MDKWATLLITSLTIGLQFVAVTLPAADYWVYLGTYTRGESKGIYVARMNSESGRLSEPELAVETPNPSFLAIHPNGRWLYAVSEMYGEGGKQGAVSAFKIDRNTGKLVLLNTVSSRGAGPCHVNIDRTGKYVAVANYGSGSVAVLPIGEDGSLGEATGFQQHAGRSVHPKRQQGPHAHSVNFSPDNRFLIVADLGLDKLMIYRFDESRGTIEPSDPPYAAVKPGSGPRHFTFHLNGRFAYAINELASTVTAFEYDGAKGSLREIQTVSTLPEGYQGENYTAEVLVHPNGRFLYASNRGHDSIAIFMIEAGGKLQARGQVPAGGSWPRNFNIDPSGKWLIVANQNSNNVVLFRINQVSGSLEATGRVVRLGSPVCVKFLAK